MTLEQIENMISKYLAAEMDVLDGKKVTLNGKLLETEDLAEIRRGRLEWEQRRNALTRRGSSIKLASF